ncbi:hypothetical protein MHH81_20855 [Psychrobacillus sp. FSL H8-0484]|uniref:hypothetical protein n=1 Tax=Psychrobacillus sp. FSL H8-0484 TaxID=2921390 RepID=UPI0030F65BFA
MTKIIFWEENGVKEVLVQITEIARLGIAGDKDAQHLARYILEGLDILKTTQLPPNQKLQAFFKEDNGDPRTLSITKPFPNNPPLLELRINRSVPGAFRAIYFEYDNDDNEKILIFTKSLLKKGDPNPPELQVKIIESYKIYLEFLKNPKKYLERSGHVE